MAVPPISFTDFYDAAAIESLLSELAAVHPGLARAKPLTTTPEGRPMWLFEVTAPESGPGARKPGYLVHANIHAHELTTTTAALHFARTLVAGYGSDEAVTELLRRVVFYVIPRLNPDCAEWALKTNGSVRSRSYPQDSPNGLTQSDVDGDGQILWVRWQDPDGEYAPHPDDPRLMLRREPGDTGPFYRMLPEGEVQDYDGRSVFASERRIDWNRQWPSQWQPEHVQGGAGDFPFSEPEMHAVGRFIIDHPNLFGMLGFHTGGNGILRPSATRDDQEFDHGDVELTKEVGQQGAELTGFPLYSVREYCNTYATDAKLRGHFTDWTYDHLGALVFEIELGNLYNSAGITTDQWQNVTARERDRFQLHALQWSEANGYGAFVDWRPFEHPQLGPVEIGGWVRYRLANPALSDLEPICEGCSKFLLHHAGLAPRLELRPIAERFGEVVRIRSEVVNVGRLATNILRVATSLRGVKGVRAALQPGAGVELLSRAALHELGHLARLNGKREVEWFVSGPAGSMVTVTAACPRAGRVEATIALP